MYTVYSCMMPRKEFTYHQVLTLVCDTGVCSTSDMPWGGTRHQVPIIF